MSTEDNVVLDIEEVSSNMEVDIQFEAEAEAKAKAEAEAKAKAEAEVEELARVEAELAAQQQQNTIVSTATEQQLDKEIRATINRNLMQQRQMAYLQAIQNSKLQRRRRFGLKFL